MRTVVMGLKELVKIQDMGFKEINPQCPHFVVIDISVLERKIDESVRSG